MQAWKERDDMGGKICHATETAMVESSQRHPSRQVQFQGQGASNFCTFFLSYHWQVQYHKINYHMSNSGQAHAFRYILENGERSKDISKAVGQLLICRCITFREQKSFWGRWLPGTMPRKFMDIHWQPRVLALMRSSSSSFPPACPRSMNNKACLNLQLSMGQLQYLYKCEAGTSVSALLKSTWMPIIATTWNASLSPFSRIQACLHRIGHVIS